MSRYEYERLVFLQCEEADEYLDFLDENGPLETVNRLLQDFDNPEPGDIHDEPARGEDDDYYETPGGYILSWCSSLGYIGLEHKRKRSQHAS